MKSSFVTGKHIFLIICFFVSFSSEAQDSKLKKLITAYSNEKNDSIKLQKVEKAWNFLKTLKTVTDAEYISVLEQLYLSQFDNYMDAEAVENSEILINFLKLKNDVKYNPLISKTAYFGYSTHDYLQNYTKALKSTQTQYESEKALFGERSEEVARVHLQFSIVYSRIDNVAEQIKSLDAAKDILEKIQVKNSQLLFDLYQYYVITYVYYGDLEKSKTYLDKMERFYDAHKTETAFMNFREVEESEIGKNQASLVLCNILFHKLPIGDPSKIEKSVLTFESSLKKGSKDYSEFDLFTINDIYSQLGVYYTKNKSDLNEAQKAYDKALALNKNFAKGSTLLNYHKGWTYTEFKQWSNAVIYFEKALTFTDSEKFIEIIALYRKLGTSYYHLGNYSKAEYYLDKTHQFYEGDSATYQGFMSLNNLLNLGELYVDIYKKSYKKDKTQLLKGFDYFKKASSLFDKIYQGDSFNTNLSNRVTEINRGLLYCATQMSDKKNEIFELVEKNKSDFLWANFLQNNSDKSLLKPKAIFDSIQRLSAEKKQFLNDKKEVLTLENQIKTLEKQLHKEHPNFISFSSNSISLKSLQKQLKTNEVVLNFVVVDSLVYGFKMTSGDLSLHQISQNAPELKDACLNYINNLSVPTSDFSTQSKTLFGILIAPFKLQRNEKLTIITNSFLSYLPFETLQNGTDFLMNNHAISYGNSIKLWNTQSLLPKSKGQRLMAFSPEYKSYDSKLDADIAMLTREGDYELKGAIKEAKLISDMFNGSYFNADQATKSNFIDNSKSHQILHLAMHSIMNEEDENLSNLIFSNNERLYFSEIYNLKIPSDLVVLSACNTGNGNYKDGEGIMSVARAFTFAGIKSTVISLWQVPDKETSEIMVSFYENLKNGQSKDEALRDAKTAFVKNNPMKSHPFYWAGFVVNGDVSPIATASSKIILFLGIGVLILLLAFAFRKRLFQFGK